MNFMLAHEFDPTLTIADVYEMPMKFQSGFCKIYFNNIPRHIIRSRSRFLPTLKRHKQVGKSSITLELNITTPTKSTLPNQEIFHSNLVVAFRLKNQHGLLQPSSHFLRMISSQIQPVRSRYAQWKI